MSCKISAARESRAPHNLQRFSVPLLLSLLLAATAVRAEVSHVTLAWDPSPATDVSTYRIYYGLASMAYTDAVSVGNVTQATITNLAVGSTYYFTATAVDSTGLESVFSNEISYNVPPANTPVVSLEMTQSGGVGLRARLTPGQTADVLSTTDLVNWQVVATLTAGPDGTFSFVDAAGRTNKQCFYRVRTR